MHFIDTLNCCAKPWKILKAHPCYDAAKNRENRTAALILVHDFLRTPENQAQIKKLKQSYSNAIVLPVHALEAGGRNRIPEMFAEYIGDNTGFDVNDSIVQTNKVHRTGSDEWYRFAFRPSFDGEVKANRTYILVDDVFTQGGSFNELRLFIERNGGKVVQAAALSIGGYGDKIAPEPDLTKSLIDKFGKNKINLFLKEIDLYDGNYKPLTNPETFVLGRAPSLDFARDRIFEARQERRPSVGQDSSQEIKTTSIGIQKPEPGRGLCR
jgi:hypothetical protein